jgi:hypothetical protein
MKDVLGIEQRLIGQGLVNSNLLKETMGKIAMFCNYGKLRYLHPARVSYDMGWQKAKKMDDDDDWTLYQSSSVLPK